METSKDQDPLVSHINHLFAQGHLSQILKLTKNSYQ